MLTNSPKHIILVNKKNKATKSFKRVSKYFFRYFMHPGKG